jgi:NB-ARC domain
MQRDIVAGFVADLVRLRTLAGTPTLNDLVALTADLEHPLARSTISDKLTVKSMPGWGFVLSFVTGCVRYADKRGTDLPEYLSDLDRWDLRHWQALSELDKARSDQGWAVAARNLIAQRVSPPPVPLELPAAVSGFTGRAAALAELNTWLNSTTTPALPIVVLSGPPGVGKSALAVQWAHSIAGRFPDGQLHLELGGQAAPERTLAAALESMGVKPYELPEDTPARARRYRTLLAGRRMLTILDDAHTAEQVRPMLPGSPSCPVVVTSRFDLAGLVARDGAKRINLTPLPDRDAIVLLGHLLGARVTADMSGAAAIARLCGGNPLALRVAAETAMASPDSTLSELAQTEFREPVG